MMPKAFRDPKTKMLLLTLSSVLTLVIGSQAGAQASPKIIAQPDASCAKTSDPNENPSRFTDVSAKYSGQCVDAVRFRAIRNLKIENGEVILNNYQHENKFWEARFSLAPENIEAVYLQIVRFPVLGIVEAGHGQTRFKLKQPVRLVSQSNPGETATAADLVISFEATFPEGQSYNFALGAMDNYGLVARVLSTAQKRLNSPNSPFEQYELNISAIERSQLLREGLGRAVEIGNRFPYNTLRPNCVSESFDLIDKLPRLRGKYPSFLTVISNDPVAAPAIAALQQRQILKQRVQNYEEEERGNLGTRPIPGGTAVPLLPNVAGRPWSLVVTLPNMQQLSATERQAVLKVREQILKQAPLALQGVGSAMMAEAGGDASAVVTGALKSLQTSLMAVLAESNAALPVNAQQLGLYIVPFKTSLAQTRLDGLGIPAALPFAITDVVVDESIRNSQEIYYHIAEGARQAGDAGAAGRDPGYLMATAVRVNLQRGNIQVRSQVMLGLNNMTKPFTMQNSQVSFQESVIKGAEARTTRPVMLITHTQVGTSRLEPSVKIEFGPEGGLAGTMAGAGFATFQINKDLSGSCQMQAASSPTLNGNLSASALGKPALDALLKGKKVSFQVLSATLNLQTQQLTEMDVRVNTWPVSCVSSADVNNQFTQNANQMLTQLKTEARDGSLLKKLVSGFMERKKN